MRKYTYEEVKEIINDLGFELLSQTYKSNRQKLDIVDKDGYFYYLCLDSIVTKEKHYKFFGYNPYTIKNIKHWCNINQKPFILISEDIVNIDANTKLKWKCITPLCEEFFDTTWGSISAGRECPYCDGKCVGLSNCLATKNSELASEWHPHKNEKLTTFDVTVNSNRRVWWQCKVNHKHEWEATIDTRNYRGRGCPYCDGQKATEENNLVVCNPDLLSEWNYEKNNKLPEEYCPTSGKSVWWKCKKGHEWKARISSRKNGRNCPYCAGYYASKDYNLLIINPKLCEQWDYEKNDKRPEEYVPNGHGHVWWICKECNNSWNAIISSRNSNGNGCPECCKSKGEKKVKEYFEFNNICHISQKEFDGLIGRGNGNLSYDFHLPQYNLLIEYQGLQHEKYVKGFHKNRMAFEIQQEHDKRKKEFAINNNIELLEIWYWDFDNIKIILDNTLISININQEVTVSNIDQASI